MTLEYHFTNFHDSGYDYENQSSMCDDDHDFLNIGFLDSPRNSVSCVDDDASRSDVVNSAYLRKNSGNCVSFANRNLMQRYGYLDSEIDNNQTQIKDVSKKAEVKPGCVFTSNSNEDFHKSSRDYAWEKMDKKSNRDEKSKMTKQATDLLEKSEENLGCVFTSTCLEDFPKSFKEYDRSKFQKQSKPDEEWKKSEQFMDLSKKTEEEAECVFTSTSLDNFPESSKEYDCGKTELEKWSKTDAEPEQKDLKIPVSVPRFDYVPHELSTILEVDSMLVQESEEPQVNSVENNDFSIQDLKDPKYLKAEDSFENVKKPKAPSNFSVNVRKFVQNSHIEKFLQEPGILDESDLTLITSAFESTCKISENSTNKSIYHNYYNSPSLISFQQHELSCMKDCEDS